MFDVPERYNSGTIGQFQTHYGEMSCRNRKAVDLIHNTREHLKLCDVYAGGVKCTNHYSELQGSGQQLVD